MDRYKSFSFTSKTTSSTNFPQLPAIILVLIKHTVGGPPPLVSRVTDFGERMKTYWVYGSVSPGKNILSAFPLWN
jgi:hypothetical protein